jgi:hypothetical protein
MLWMQAHAEAAQALKHGEGARPQWPQDPNLSQL